MTLEELNALGKAEAHHAFHSCCGSETWAAAMTAARPFASAADLFAAAERAADALTAADWHEAFRAHPRIGDREVLARRLADGKDAWTRQEQAGMTGAPDELLDEIDRLNTEYEKRFGHIFLICATGLTGEDLRDALRLRRTNEPAHEFANACGEQRRITRIRLEKLLT